MDYKAVISIDMSRYGQSGMVEVCAPSFRKRTAMSNELTRRIVMEQTRTGTKVQNIPAGDWGIMQKMLYVKSAPFQTDVEGFLAYTDIMDASNPGSADAFWDDLDAAIQRIDSGEASPLDGSQEAGTPTSD